MQTYIGYLVRKYVSIEYVNWRAVPKQTKTNLHQSIKNVFDFPTVMTQKMILRSAGDKWKNFKNAFSKFVVREGELSTEPPLKYSFINKHSWEKLVQLRCTKEFQDKSRINAEHAKQKNILIDFLEWDMAAKTKKC